MPALSPWLFDASRNRQGEVEESLRGTGNHPRGPPPDQVDTSLANESEEELLDPFYSHQDAVIDVFTVSTTAIKRGEPKILVGGPMDLPACSRFHTPRR